MRIHLLTWFLCVETFAAAAGQSFEFAVIGDTRPRFESESFKPFETLIGRINSLHPALVVNLGDLIYGYGPLNKEKQWDRYEAVVRSFQQSYYQLPGNHDTYSRKARDVYQKRFKVFYQSFDYSGCHFVLLDNNEEGRWGYLSPVQLEWLREDLRQTQARAVFVFMHFPVWEPERITPAYHELWAQTLHPLFRASRVRAVFGGHYHTYGPTREFDGIRYFITGGGGAELRPEYKKAGGEFHFMKIRIAGDDLDVRVVTERGELSDPDADVMGGLLFASRTVSRIGIDCQPADLRAGTSFAVSVHNPYSAAMRGEAFWLLDAGAFHVEPSRLMLDIPPGATRRYSFKLQALQDVPALQSLPRLEFKLAAEGKLHRFHREVRFLQHLPVPNRAATPDIDGGLSEWQGVPRLLLSGSASFDATLQGCCDGQNLYLGFSVPMVDAEEFKESGLSDEVQIGFSRNHGETDFGPDIVRLGLSSAVGELVDRTPGRKQTRIVGARSACRSGDGRTTYEVALPLSMLGKPKVQTGEQLILDLSFPAPEMNEAGNEAPGPGINTFGYRVRYGSDSLVPVHFIGLSLGR